MFYRTQHKAVGLIYVYVYIQIYIETSIILDRQGYVLCKKVKT